MQKLLVLVALCVCASYAAICYTQGDPHNALLGGNAYNMYNVQGDFNFFQYNGVKVQERVSYSRNWRTNSLSIGAAVKFGSNVFELTNDVTRLNGRVATAAQLRAAGVQISGNVFTITYNRIIVKVHNHNVNDDISGRNYVAVFVEVPEDIRREFGRKIKGLCVENDVPRYAVRNAKKSLFANPAKYITLPPQPRRKFTKKETRAARKACRSTGIEYIVTLENCVYDYLRANNKETVLRSYKSDHQDKLRLREVEKKTAADNKINLDKCRASFASLERQLANVNRALDAARSDNRNLQSRINNLHAEANSLRQQLNAARNQLAAAEAQVRNYISQNNGLRNNLNRAQNENRNLVNQINALRNQYAQLQRDCQNRLNQVQRHYEQQIRQLNVQYNNNLQSALRQQSQQFQRQLQNALTQQQQQFQRSFGQMQSYYAQLIAAIQNVLNQHKRNLPNIKF